MCAVQNYTYTPNKALADELDPCDPAIVACSSTKKRKLAEEANPLVKTSSAVKSRSSAKRVRIIGCDGSDNKEEEEEEEDVYTEDLYTIADAADCADAHASNKKPSSDRDADSTSFKSDSESRNNGPLQGVAGDSRLSSSRALGKKMAPRISPERCVLQFGNDASRDSEQARAGQMTGTGDADDEVVKPASTNTELQRLQQRLACVSGSKVQGIENSTDPESDAIEGTPLRRSTRNRNAEVGVCVCVCV